MIITHSISNTTFVGIKHFFNPLPAIGQFSCPSKRSKICFQAQWPRQKWNHPWGEYEWSHDSFTRYLLQFHSTLAVGSCACNWSHSSRYVSRCLNSSRIRVKIRPKTFFPYRIQLFVSRMLAGLSTCLKMNNLISVSSVKFFKFLPLQCPNKHHQDSLLQAKRRQSQTNTAEVAGFARIFSYSRLSWP